MNREQLFWGAVGVLLLAIGAVYVFSARPAWLRVAGNEKDREMAMAEFTQLNNLNKVRLLNERVPRVQDVQVMTEYKKWLADQADTVEQHFRRKSERAEHAPLTPTPDPSRNEFKAAYEERLRALMKSVNDPWQGNAVEEKFFHPSSYKWLKGATLPEEQDFPAIVRDLRIREQIFQVLVASKTRSISNLEIGEPRAAGRYATPLQVKLTVSLPPDEVMALLRSFFEVRGGDAPDLFIVPKGLILQKDAGESAGNNPVVHLALAFDVLDFPPPREEVAPGDEEKKP